MGYRAIFILRWLISLASFDAAPYNTKTAGGT
jgi:hypothetical protein